MTSIFDSTKSPERSTSQKHLKKSRARTRTRAIAGGDITDPTFLKSLSKTRLDVTLDPTPSDAFKIGGWRLARRQTSSSKH
jgi:hypothetical protein